jgi:hypothetical protein
MFSFLYHCHDFYRTWLYIWVTRRVSYKKQELPTLRKHVSSSSVFFVGFVLLIFLVFFVVLLCVFTFLFVGVLMFYLRYLCFFVHCGVQHILCFVFVLFFFVLCNLCCQFLWIVHFWLPLRYSLTFISHIAVSHIHLELISQWSFGVLISDFTKNGQHVLKTVKA